MIHYGFTIIRQAKNKFGFALKESDTSLVFESKKEPLVFSFDYQKNERFAADKLFFKTKDLIAGIDGVILNLADLKKAYGINDWQSLFEQLYKKHGAGFINQLYGEFSGFIFEKTTERLLYFTNHCATKKVYHHHTQQQSIIAPSIQTISDFLEKQQQIIRLDKTSAYSLLSYGGNYGTHTLIEEVFRLHGGTYLELQQERLQVKKYFDYNAIEIKEQSEQAVMEQLEASFQEAIRMEYEKDLAYGHRHFATLSGGLDSRMNIFLAQEQGYQTSNLCFAQKGYDDELIAQEISKYLNQEFQFVPLDGGKYVLDFEENMDIYEGQIFYTTSAHFNYAIKKIDLQPFGLIHTGLLGDGFLGTLISSPEPCPPKVNDKLISGKLFPRIQQEMEQLGKNYVSDDVYQIHQRCFNIAVSGCWAMEQYSYLVSPFMYPDFIKTCLSMPTRYKYQQKIYIKWINRYHPELSRFKWEATGFRPKYTWQREASRYSKKAKSIWYRLKDKSHKLNMTPYQYWYQTNPDLSALMESVFNNKIGSLTGDAVFQKEVSNLFKQGNAVEKTMVMTLLGGIEKLKLTV